MDLSLRVSKALAAFRQSESAEGRGPLFKDVALALEQEMRQPGVSESTVLECFGRPDLQSPGFFLYVFDHHKAGGARDEWYFYFREGKLSNSGYNRRGINTFPTDEVNSTEL